MGSTQSGHRAEQSTFSLWEDSGLAMCHDERCIRASCAEDYIPESMMFCSKDDHAHQISERPWSDRFARQRLDLSDADMYHGCTRSGTEVAFKTAAAESVLNLHRHHHTGLTKGRYRVLN
eukprot:Tamp_30948.p1 GENE.Tamp_30948~~Tamp_30948.p1  ORF type:complete len:120 (+),score=12.70 Tamp_30948:58-417(+)